MLAASSGGQPDAVLIDAALRSLLERHRAMELDAQYAAYDTHPLDEPDEWGDLSVFPRRSIGLMAQPSRVRSGGASRLRSDAVRWWCCHATRVSRDCTV